MIQVYTSITNNHDPPRDDIPVLGDTPYSKDCPLQLARLNKALGPAIHFPESEWTIWIDGNVFLNVSPEVLVKKCKDQPFGVFAHFHNNTLQEEAAAIKQAYPEHAAHCTCSPAYVTLPVAMTMVLVRRTCPEMLAASSEWWELMQTTKCYRDQMTFPRAFAHLGSYWPAVDFTKPNEFFTRIQA